MVKVHHKTFKKATFNSGRKRKVRSKTFKSEESAKRWAETNGVKNYTLENLKSTEALGKKLRITIQ